MTKSTMIVPQFRFAVCTRLEYFQPLCCNQYKNFCLSNGTYLFKNQLFNSVSSICHQNKQKHRLTFADVNSKSIQVDLKLLQNLISSNNHMSDFSRRNGSFSDSYPYNHFFHERKSGILELSNSQSIANMTNLPAMTLAGTRLFSQNATDNDQQNSDDAKASSDVPKTKIAQLKRIFAVYGTFGFVFHIIISLISLGICYLIVSSGIDAVGILKKMGFELSSMASGASTMVMAYAIHKLILPLRATVTIVSVPILVRHLRKAGYLKK